MPVTDSSTGEVFAEAPCCTAAEVEEAIQTAHEAFQTWSTTSIQKRTQVLYRWKALLEQHAEEITVLCARELGKNLDEARGEVIKIIEGCEVGVSAPMTMKGESLMNVSTGHDTVSYREPLGVFAGIAPFNFPGMIPFGWMLPALHRHRQHPRPRSWPAWCRRPACASSSCSSRPACPRASSTS